MSKRPWDDFSQTRSQSFVRELVSQASDVSPNQLVALADYRKTERTNACDGYDPIRIILAYAQDELAFDSSGNLITVSDRTTYNALSRERRLNKFGHAYRRDATFWLHRTLADIVVGAAIRLYKTHRWTTVLYDGLRTVEGAYKLYCYATDDDISAGLLALPGQSAHNKGLAVDSMMVDEAGHEVDMGGHFDHLDMATNGRTYNGPLISEAAKKNRLIREAAFLYSAFTQQLLVAPLRNEFWDDRLPENREDLWRVLDSAARCLGISLLSPEDEQNRRFNRSAFSQKWESWSYDDFLSRWQDIFYKQEDKLLEVIGTTLPPHLELPEFYHGNYHPIYDRELIASGKHLTSL